MRTETNYFQTSRRESAEAFVTFADDAPEWVRDAVMAAHDGEMPNDWRYAACEAIFAAVADGDTDGFEWADSYVDVYSSELATWLADNLNRDAYCTEALEEYGADGLTGAFDLIRVGQMLCLRQMFDTIAEAVGDDDDEGED